MRKRMIFGALVVLATLGTSAAPAMAQELVDASGEGGGGGLAFVLMTVMVFVIGGSLFFMDKIRRRVTDEQPPR
jgi:hypothetical protein